MAKRIENREIPQRFLVRQVRQFLGVASKVHHTALKVCFNSKRILCFQRLMYCPDFIRQFGFCFIFLIFEIFKRFQTHEGVDVHADVLSRKCYILHRNST